MGRLCADVAARCEVLRHIHMPRVLVTFTPSRNRSRYGLQARVTPLRFRNGALTRRHGSVEYQVQRFFVDGREMLYLLTFCLPRFLDQSFDEKLVTVFHELFHMNPAFRRRPPPPSRALRRPFALQGPLRLAHGRTGSRVRRGPSGAGVVRLPPVGLSRVVGHARRDHRRGRAPAQAAAGRLGRRPARRPAARATERECEIRLHFAAAPSRAVFHVL